VSGYGNLPAFEQAKFRSIRIYRDQHNRQYDVTVDTRDPALTWVAIPIPRYKVPDKRMYPPANFLKPVLQEMGRMRVDYDAWLALTIENEDAFNTELLKICQAQNPNDALRLYENPTKEILRLAGPRPMPSELVRAMRAGNAWALGMKPANEVPPWVNTSIKEWIKKGTPRNAVVVKDDDARFLIEDAEQYADYEEQHDPNATGGKRQKVRKSPTTPMAVAYQHFVKKHTAEGKNLKEISVLWKVEKEQLAASMQG
jgi:hypothetical protein